MHILVVPSWYPTPYAPLSGIFFGEQAEALARAGHQVGVIHPDQRSLRTLALGHLALGYRSKVDGVVPVLRHSSMSAPKMHAWNGRRWVTFAERLFLRYTAEHGVPDVIHAHSAIWAGVAAARIWRAFGIPYVLTEHSSGFARRLFKGWQQPFLAEAFGAARSVIAVSEALRSELVTFRPSDEVRVVPNAVDTETFHLPTKPRPRDPFRFMCVAFLDRTKAVDLLLEAFAAAFPRDDAIRLDIVGDGPEAPRLLRLSRTLRVGRRVTFHGERDRLGVREVLWSSHCCVSSSRVETFGVSLIEALATGIPVVATRSGGPQDIVSSNCGILTEVGSVTELAEAMRAVHSARDSWRQRSEELRASAERRFSQPVVVDQLCAQYRSAIQGSVEWPSRLA